IPVAALLRQKRSFMEQRAHVRRIETENTRKGMHGVALATEREQCLAKGEQRVEMIRIALEKLDEQRERIAGTSEPAAQGRELQRRFGVRGHGIERRDELLLGFAVLPLELKQMRELKANDGEVMIELQRMAIRHDRALVVAEGA